LYADIPDSLRFQGELDLPPALPSAGDLRRHMSELLARNTPCDQFLNFLGSGCCQHDVPPGAGDDPPAGRRTQVQHACGAMQRRRRALGAYGNVRPLRGWPGVLGRYAEVDIVIVRETTEDVYAGIERKLDDDAAEAVKRTTRSPRAASPGSRAIMPSGWRSSRNAAM
jgi:hypothetical protein